MEKVLEKQATRVYLIRHGETEWNQNTPGYCGWTDIPLNAKGRSQAKALGRFFESVPLDRVLSSDFQRARHTAEAIAAHAGCAPVTIDARFRELNYGEWEGRTGEQLEAEDPDRFRAWKADPERVATPGGETLQQVLDRSAAALEEYVQRSPGGTLALVAHKTTVRLLLCWALGLSPGGYLRILQQNAAINAIEFRGSRPVVALVNDTCHLPPDLISPAL